MSFVLSCYDFILVLFRLCHTTLLLEFNFFFLSLAITLLSYLCNYSSVKGNKDFQRVLSVSRVLRVHGVQAVQDRLGQHAAGAGPGSVQQEVRRGIGHQVPRPSALQEDQEQPGLGHHRRPPPRHPLQEALHLRLPEPGADPGGRRQNQLHHHQVGRRNDDFQTTFQQNFSSDLILILCVFRPFQGLIPKPGILRISL